MKASDRYFVEGVSCRLDGQPMRVANLSVGGFYAATGRPPMPGQVVVMQLELAGREPFEILGQVTWVNPKGDAEGSELPPGFGVKITKIAFPDKLAILDLLRRMGPQAMHRGS